ncbi:cell wall hydrolase [Devosia sp. MC532]|nr:cell wall hydrolase [Devosia sp. MC521]MBJ7577610.1 cell wall hydrolase [Devosia sp. MC532]QMW63260.1 cell wall hydrolase [Devosia sp. MC521]
MALSHRPEASARPVSAVSRGRPFAKGLALSAFASLAYVGLIGGALAPTADAPKLPNTAPTIDEELASLTYNGVDPIITGSVDHLFQTDFFTGPNRAEKVTRVRQEIDMTAINEMFEKARTEIASLRGTSIDHSPVNVVAEVTMPEPPRVAVAGLHPSAAAALDAIAGIAPSVEGATVQGSIPMPEAMPTQLAYARATAPATVTQLQGTPMADVSDKEMWCLATAVYFEARGEVYRGQVAVAQVVLNRVKDHRYPNTICGVVFQNQHKRNACQFSFACDGIPDTVTERQPWATAEEVAQKVVSGELYLTEVGSATHYHASYVRPAWAPRMEKLTQIGLHHFYKFKKGWLFG